jgi:ribosomal protein S24E
MELKIENKEEKKLVERLEIRAKATGFQATPSNAQIKEELAKQLGKPAELIIIKSIYQKFGSLEASILAYVYNSPESLKKFETRKKEKKTPGAPAAE